MTRAFGYGWMGVHGTVIRLYGYRLGVGRRSAFGLAGGAADQAFKGVRATVSGFSSSCLYLQSSNEHIFE